MLDSLHIQNFRCFEDLTIPSLGRVNLIVGKNNVGKSTLLESIMFHAQSSPASFITTLLSSRNEYFDGKLEYSGTGSISVKSSNRKSCIEQDQDYDGHNYINSGELCGTETQAHIKPTDIPVRFVKTQISSETQLAQQWDSAYLNSDEDLVKDSLSIIDSDIVNVIFVQSPISSEDRIAAIKLKGKSAAVPLKAMGEGVGRILQIFLNAIQAKNGILLIDEFENGLHYSIHEKVWEKLFHLAMELDMQIFATTHSLDTIRTFNKIALSHPGEEQLISLGHSATSGDNGKITATSFNESELRLFLESEMEVR